LNNFDKNKPALEKDPKIAEALAELQGIYNHAAPYNQLHKIAPLIALVTQFNDAQLQEKRNHAIERIEIKIQQLQNDIKTSGIETADLSNKLLRPLQLLKETILVQNSIPQIYMLQTQTAGEKFDHSLDELNSAIEQAAKQRSALELQSREKEAKETGAPPTSEVIKEKPLVIIKPIEEVSVVSVFDKVSPGGYIETPEQMAKFIEALKQRLESAVNEGSRVRIR